VLSYDVLDVGYQGGLWNLGFQYVGTKQLSVLTVILQTPIQTVLCTGFNGGLQFPNCVSGTSNQYVAGNSWAGTQDPGGAFSANATFSGYSTGAGPGSAVVGKTYTVTIAAIYADGTTVTYTIPLQASVGS